MTLVNEFAHDAAYCYGRAAKLLKQEMSPDDTLDTALYFAFAIEKTCQAIVWEINPVFVLQDVSLEAAVNCLYRDRLPRLAKNNASEYHFASISQVLKRSISISPTIRSRVNVINELAGLRNTIAHRRLSEISLEGTSKLVRRLFYPLVHEFSGEVTLDLNVCFAAREADIRRISKYAEEDAQLEESMVALLKKHESLWETRKSNEAFIKNADSTTSMMLEDFRNTEYYHIEHECPACGNHAAMRIESDWESEDGYPMLTGVYVGSLTCAYCDLLLDGENIDYFKYNDQLNELLN